MSQRKPPGVSFETWIDRQIREAAERGEFDGLPGTGKPLADLDRPTDEMWWIRQKMRRENLSYLPPTLALRKEAEDALASAAHAPSEADARRIVEDVNGKIREANRMPSLGPPLGLVPFDVERIVRDWRDRHGDQGSSAPARHEAGGGESPAEPRSARRRGRLWRRGRPGG